LELKESTLSTTITKEDFVILSVLFTLEKTSIYSVVTL